MSSIHSLLAASYLPLRFGNELLRCAKVVRHDRLRILIYHDIAPWEEGRFAEQLRWLARTWRFISPQEFAGIVRGEKPIKGANLLLTFDDGFASNRRVVEQVLNPMGIAALFFVVSDFMDLTNQSDCRQFIARNIHPGIPLSEIPAHWRNMTWEDLAFLLETGHTIGAHTRTHARLSDVSDREDLESEIIGSADTLERKLGVKVDCFAYTFGNLNSFSQAALSEARHRFPFIFTGMRGDNARGVPPWALRRDAMAAVDSLSLVGALLEGGADLFYSRNLEKYEQWGHRTQGS